MYMHCVLAFIASEQAAEHSKVCALCGVVDNIIIDE